MIHVIQPTLYQNNAYRTVEHCVAHYATLDISFIVDDMVAMAMVIVAMEYIQLLPGATWPSDPHKTVCHYLQKAKRG